MVLDSTLLYVNTDISTWIMLPVKITASVVEDDQIASYKIQRQNKHQPVNNMMKDNRTWYPQDEIKISPIVAKYTLCWDS